MFRVFECILGNTVFYASMLNGYVYGLVPCNEYFNTVDKCIYTLAKLTAKQYRVGALESIDLKDMIYKELEPINKDFNLSVKDNLTELRINNMSEDFND